MVEIVSVSQATMMAMMTLGSVFPIIPAIIKAQVVGKYVFDVIEREPLIKSPPVTEKSCNIKLEQDIQFENVHFQYPTAPEGANKVFQGVNFVVKAFESTAIVGPSGSGKSTIV